MAPEYTTIERTLKLPPLILHPFSDSSSPSKLMQGSRASLMLQGILPNEHQTMDQLEELLLEGKVCEIRMLYYVGKDLLRWIEQCVEFVGRAAELQGLPARPQTFATLLIDDAPEPVRDKLRTWGVQDYRAIFSRAIGLNAVFGSAPTREVLSEEFIRAYHTYSDQMFAAWSGPPTTASQLPPSAFDFDLYASAEYSRILERQWESDDD